MQALLWFPHLDDEALERTRDIEILKFRKPFMPFFGKASLKDLTCSLSAILKESQIKREDRDANRLDGALAKLNRALDSENGFLEGELRRTFLAIMLLCGVVAGLGTWFGGKAWLERARIEWHGTAVEATIVDRNVTARLAGGQPHHSYWITLQWRIEGQDEPFERVQSVPESLYEAHPVGSTRSIVYLPGEPWRFLVPGDTFDGFAPILCAVIGLACAGFIGFLMWRGIV